MTRLPGSIALSIILAFEAFAQDKFVPPVPKGIRGERVVEYHGPVPLPPETTKWIRVRSPRFNIVSSASEKETRRVALTLETFADALGAVHPRLRAGQIETRVFLFARRRESEPYFQLLLHRTDLRTAGLFISHGDGSGTMFLDAGFVWANRTVIHELVHNILATSGTHLPLWLEEGIAEYFSTATLTKDRLSIGSGIRQHQFAVRTRRGLPLTELFAMKYDSKAAMTTMGYAQCWAIVDFLMRAGEPRFYRFVADVENGVDVDTSLRRNFGLTTSIVDQSIRRAPLRPTPRRTVQVQEHTTAISAEPLTYADAMISLGSFLGVLEFGRGDAERHLLAANGVPLATSQRGMIRALDRKYDEAYTFFEDALAKSPEDAEIRLQYAEALLQNNFGPFAGASEISDEDKPRFRKARELLETTSPTVDAWRYEAILGSTYLVEDDVADGVERLERALAARPSRMDVALNLYALLLRADNDVRADEIFNQYFGKARNPQTVFAARAVYVREKLTLVNTLIHAQRMDEAAVLLRQIIDRTPEPAAKSELELQLVNLDRIAKVNREILVFNQAVAAANAGENATAIRILDTLLVSAEDEKLLRDAKALREVVRTRPGMRR